ncbi:SgcJ/EcaC family oxidoreductase [Micromonospora sp. PLK6-60]|uniref:YybH family protein n=1 Tax=Micromonospora sp. PLK6-60 TaxID=2873383 RepID=UPI001CA65528|nr:SgcJ/EcaC family oxidoreductase [Micromonospora sp. PLK6-60]MBY8875136.1 SgcJ/EcaC family oxidoreductase [Micromonospora sp. PLK6-60]
METTTGPAASATDEELIRRLIEDWAAAVHRGELAGVLADHTDDIVMFDVPAEARGLAAYRDSWPPFLRWQAQGARFEITELAVTVGDTVAFAHALLRCGTPDDLAGDPQPRLRLTLGLRREDGRWLVSHEHHSFADTSGTLDAEREVRDLHRRWYAATAAGDLDGLMAPVATDVVSYEHEAPLRYVGVDQVRDVCERGLRAGPAQVRWEVPDLTVRTAGDLAVAWGLNRVVVGEPDDPTEHWSRGTRVFRRVDGDWRLVHQHVSYPFAPETGRARTDLRP